MNDSKGAGGLIAAIIAILVASLLIGGSATGLFGKIFGIVRTAAIVGGIGILAIVLAVIVAAFATKKKDTDASEKAEINKMITEKRQLLAKMKSSIIVIGQDLKRIRDNIETENKKINYYDNMARTAVEKGDDAGAKQALLKKQQHQKTKETLELSEAEYQKSVDEISRLAGELDTEIKTYESRMKEAMAKLKLAEVKETSGSLSGTYGDVSMKEEKERIQYLEDYAEALSELNGDKYKEYDSNPTPADTMNIDEELEKLKDEKKFSSK